MLVNRRGKVLSKSGKEWTSQVGVAYLPVAGVVDALFGDGGAATNHLPPPAVPCGSEVRQGSYRGHKEVIKTSDRGHRGKLVTDDKGAKGITQHGLILKPRRCQHFLL